MRTRVAGEVSNEPVESVHRCPGTRVSVPVSPAGDAHERVLERKRLSAGTYMGAAVGLGAGRVAGRGGNRERPGVGRDVCQQQPSKQALKCDSRTWDDMTVKSDSAPAFYPIAQQMKCQSGKGDRLALPHRPQAPGTGWCRSSTASLRETASGHRKCIWTRLSGPVHTGFTAGGR